ncbi:chorismate mutase [Corynebacterium lactis]|uniref:Chorismate mutase n=1 Tax=Corynebacterium lactis RW2-5 TaxID=1408189 RepID=A0A0K2GYD8_9CORY|nr:chorismate mutase [Corynebacterium lactis]ALA66797.1 chorismate mutase [Corynebacterium lactis RW2-5]
MSENPSALSSNSDNETPAGKGTAAVSPFEVRTPTGTDDPLSSAEIEQYRQEINRLDNLIIDAIRRRTAISKAVGKTRLGSGGTRLVHGREVQIINSFRDELGPEGPAIASALLRMGRGRLG